MKLINFTTLCEQAGVPALAVILEYQDAPEVAELPRSPRKLLTTKELDYALELLSNNTGRMTSSEINKLAKENALDYDRTASSLKFAMGRLYTIIHGEYPLDLVDNAGWYEKTPKTLLNYAESKGYDVVDSRRKADIDLKHRQAKPKMDREKALSVFSNYFKSHAWNLDYDKVQKYRKDIVNAIQNGEHVDVAFGPYFDPDAGKKGRRGYKGDVNYREEFENLRNRLSECWKATRMIKETSDSTMRFYEIGDMLNDALVKYNAAKQGLGISNKLKDPAQRAVHRSRIMSNLNSLRALVRKIEQSL
jgi:hypothetical protein